MNKLCENTWAARCVASFLAFAMLMVNFLMPFLAAEARGHGGGGGGGMHYSGRSYSYSAPRSYSYSQRSYSYSPRSYSYSAPSRSYSYTPSRAYVRDYAAPRVTIRNYNTRVYRTVTPLSVYNTPIYAGVPGVYGGYFRNGYNSYYGLPLYQWYSGHRRGWYEGRYWDGYNWVVGTDLAVLAALELSGNLDGVTFYPYSQFNTYWYSPQYLGAPPAAIYGDAYWNGASWYDQGIVWGYDAPDGFYRGRYWRHNDRRWATAAEVAAAAIAAGLILSQ